MFSHFVYLSFAALFSQHLKDVLKQEKKKKKLKKRENSKMERKRLKQIFKFNLRIDENRDRKHKKQFNQMSNNNEEIK